MRDRADLDDSEAESRRRLEEQASARFREAGELADALDTVEAAAARVGGDELPVLAERLLRAGSRALHRLERAEKHAVRERLAEGKGR